MKPTKDEIILSAITPILGVLVGVMLYQPPGDKVFAALPGLILPYRYETLRAIGIAIIVALSGPAMAYLKYSKRIESIINNTPLMLQDVAIAVRSGTKVYAAFLQVIDRDYGALTKYVRKIASLIYVLGLDLIDAIEMTIIELPRQTKKYFYMIEEAYESGGRAVEVLNKASDLARRIREFEEEREKSLKTQGFIIIMSVMIFIGTAAILYYLSVQMWVSTEQLKQKMPEAKLTAIDPYEVLGYLFYLSFSLSIFAGLTAGKMVKGSVGPGLYYAELMLVISILTVIALPYVIPPHPNIGGQQTQLTP